MQWWEFGEHAAWALAPLAKLASLVWKCRCDARRRWLNERGELLFAYWFQTAHDDLHAGFEDVVATQLRIHIQSAVEIHYRLKQLDLRVSLHTTARWLDDLVAEGELTTLVMSGLRHYGFPARTIVTSSNNSARIS